MNVELTVRSEELEVQLESFRGPQGPAGEDYVLTEEDKQEIAGMIGTTGGGAAIDDSKISAETTYSSEKIESGWDDLHLVLRDQINDLEQNKANSDDLAAVAKSGSYSDLKNRPTIPTALKNPNALTFKGAVSAQYDGSAAVEIEITEGKSETWTFTLADGSSVEKQVTLA